MVPGCFRSVAADREPPVRSGVSVARTLHAPDEWGPPSPKSRDVARASIERIGTRVSLAKRLSPFLAAP